MINVNEKTTKQTNKRVPGIFSASIVLWTSLYNIIVCSDNSIKSIFWVGIGWLDKASNKAKKPP